MSDIKRWSKEFDPQEVKLPSNEGGEIAMSKAFTWLDWLAHDIEESVNLIRVNSSHSLDFRVEPHYDEYGLRYSRGFDNLYKKLVELTESGYDVREFWRNFREQIFVIWKYLPEYSSYVRTRDGIQIEQPSDYDPEKPFPQYPIPEDIEE